MPLRAAAILLGSRSRDGFQGDAREKKAQGLLEARTWRTWKDAPQPAIAASTSTSSSSPRAAGFQRRGTYDAASTTARTPLTRFALTGGPHWENVEWTLERQDYKPEDRAGLYVFTPPAPLAPGDS